MGRCRLPVSTVAQPSPPGSSEGSRHRAAGPCACRPSACHLLLAGGGEHQRRSERAKQHNNRENTGFEHERASMTDGISPAGRRSRHHETSRTPPGLFSGRSPRTVLLIRCRVSDIAQRPVVVGEVAGIEYLRTGVVFAVEGSRVRRARRACSCVIQPRRDGTSVSD